MGNTYRWEQLVGRLLNERQQKSASTARIRRGLNPYTQTWAYGYVLPYAAEGRNHPKSDGLTFHETALLRASAIIASHPDIPQSDDPHQTIGASFLSLSRALAKDRDFSVNPDKPDLVAIRLRGLSALDLDEAANSFHRLLTLADKTSVSINYFALTHRLLRWGTGVSIQSLNVRESTLAEYYRAVPAMFTRKTTQPQSKKTDPAT